MALAARISYRHLRVAGPFLMLAALIGLVLVKVPGIGLRVNGAERWIAAGPITIQPSEFAKLAVVVLDGRRCSPRASGRRAPSRSWRTRSASLALVICALVALEPDLGTTIAIAITITGMLIVAGTPLRLLAGTFAVLGTGAAFVISQNAYMHARLLAFMHPFHDAGGSGYQNAQALIALGSGGIWGKGLGQGTQKIFYLPESPSDMIAAVIGEELGLIGILVTALAFAGFAVPRVPDRASCARPVREVPRGRRDVPRHGPGGREPRRGARASCPLTGVPLPLISSGGSSLVVFMTLSGTLLNVAQAERRPVRATVSTSDATKEPRPRSRTANDGADRSRRNRGPRRAVAGGGRRAHG